MKIAIKEKKEIKREISEFKKGRGFYEGGKDWREREGTVKKSYRGSRKRRVVT